MIRDEPNGVCSANIVRNLMMVPTGWGEARTQGDKGSNSILDKR